MTRRLPKKRSSVTVVQRPTSWTELGWAYVLGVATAIVVFACGIAYAIVVFACGIAYAGGPTVVTWDQGSDCGVITGWELVAAPVTSANPNPQPTTATLMASIPQTGPCGLAMTRTVSTTGVGPTRFWLRAVAGAQKSGESNHVDASLALGKPGLTSVAP